MIRSVMAAGDARKKLGRPPGKRSGPRKADRPGRFQVGFQLPLPLVEAVRRACVEDGCTMTMAVTVALAGWLRAREAVPHEVALELAKLSAREADGKESRVVPLDVGAARARRLARGLASASLVDVEGGASDGGADDGRSQGAGE